MESLALLVAVIVAPAMFGGPIALVLSLWRLERISPLRRIVILVLSIASALIGIYLCIGGISRGAIFIGLMGIGSGAAALWRIFKFAPNRNN